MSLLTELAYPVVEICYRHSAPNGTLLVVTKDLSRTFLTSRVPFKSDVPRQPPRMGVISVTTHPPQKRGAPSGVQ